MSSLKGSLLGQSKGPTKIKHNFDGNGGIQETVFYDSQGRPVLVNDQVRLVSETGNVNFAIVTGIGKDRLGLSLEKNASRTIEAKTSLSQSDVSSRPHRMISITAEKEGRPIRELDTPSISSVIKTTLDHRSPGGS